MSDALIAESSLPIEGVGQRWIWSPTDRRSLIVLLTIPVLLFGIPTLLGHPPIAADNLIQNYPLRVLSGRLMASGHLPVWNFLTFSGEPLLGGMNAGSFFPLTFLFVFLPPLAAWFLNLAACYWAAGIGLYVLARWMKTSVLGAFIGAVVYTYMGAMIGQMVHLAVIQGQALLPWTVLALLVVGDRLRGASSSESMNDSMWSAGPALLGLVLIGAFIGLTGEPRAIADLEIVVITTVIYLAVARGRVSWRRRVAVVAAPSIALVWGFTIAAAQLIPGWSFITLSQRANLGLDFFGSGSLSFPKAALLLIPDLSGGTGLFHQPTYFIDYNLPEVTGYVGVIGLAALFAAIGSLVTRAKEESQSRLGFLVALGLVGLVCAMGTFTPLGAALGHVPLLGKTRLQSRSIIVFDLAVSVVLGWFVTRFLASTVAILAGWRRWVAAIPALATAGLAVLMLVWPYRLEEAFSANSVAAVEGHFLAPWFVVSLVLAIATVLLLVRGARWSPSRRRLALCGLVASELVFLLMATTTGLVPGNVPVNPSRNFAASVLGTSGRFALVDPLRQHFTEFTELGEPNTNVFTVLPSVQGYGSLVGGTYGAATGTHLQNGLDACSLERGRFRQLRLNTLVISSEQLAPQLSTGESSTGVTEIVPPVVPCPGAPPATATSYRDFYFGQILTVRSITLSARSIDVMKHPSLVSSLRVTLFDGSNHPLAVRSAITPTADGWSIALARPAAASGFRITGPIHQVMQTSSVVDASGAAYWLAGPMQEAVDGSRWRLVETRGTLQVFRTTQGLKPHAWIQGGRAQGRVISTIEQPNGGEVDVVRMKHAGVLVRSEAWLPGWEASVVPVGGGRALGSTVVPADLVQSLHLGAGSFKVTFSYHAPHLLKALILSAVSLVALMVAGVVVRRRRSLAGSGAGRVRP